MTKLISLIFLYTFLGMVHIYLEEVVCDENTLQLACFKLGFISWEFSIVFNIFFKLLDVSETASEAWSTDVLASDSERLTEVDTDDAGSVARSDDTARSEVEVEGRGEPEGEEDCAVSVART